MLPTGHLVYVQNGTLFAAPFNAKRLTVSGDRVPLAAGIAGAVPSVGGQFAIAANGMLAFRPGAGETTLRRLVWVDRQGRETPIGAPPRAYVYPRLSPDATKIAVSLRDEEHDIWVFDLSKETLTRVTFGPEAETFPVWSVDGRHLLFGSSESSLPAVALSRCST